MATKKKKEAPKEKVEKAPKAKPAVIPPAPKTNPLMGEYTPEYLGWVKKYHPKEYAVKYADKVREFKYEVIEPK